MDADAGRVRTALRLQAVAARVHHMDCAGFAEEVCDAVDVAPGVWAIWAACTRL